MANTPVSNQPPAPVGAAAPAENSPVLSLQIGVVVVAALYFAKEVLIPVTLAILLSFVLAPLE
jgi:predicted PurR-regulated permease PerM